MKMFGWLKKSTPTSVGLFGKIPDEGDFVSHNATDPAIGVFDQWLQSSIDKARHAGAEELPPTPVRFVFRGADPKSVLIGVMMPSRDAVGRIFPLAAFATCSAARLAGKFSTIPFLFKEFFEAITELLSSADERGLEDLAEELDEIEAPDLDGDEAAEAMRPMLDSARSTESWEALFGAEHRPNRYYAFQTFAVACRAVQKEDLTKSGATIDCPVQNEEDVAFWLSLAQKQLAWRKAPPSIFWTEGAAPRLLLSLGPAGGVVLLSLLRPELDSPKLWSLKTKDTAARDAAKGSFLADQQQIIEQDGVSNEALIASLARP